MTESFGHFEMKVTWGDLPKDRPPPSFRGQKAKARITSGDVVNVSS